MKLKTILSGLIKILGTLGIFYFLVVATHVPYPVNMLSAWVAMLIFAVSFIIIPEYILKVDR